MMKIAVLPGDGIGKEVTAEAVKVLTGGVRDSVPHEFIDGVIGDDSISAGGEPLPVETMALAQNLRCDPARRRRRARRTRGGRSTVRRRRAADACASISGSSPTSARCSCSPSSSAHRPCRPEIVEGVDLVILRELNGDLYFGKPRGFETEANGARAAYQHDALFRAGGGEASRMPASRRRGNGAASSVRWTRRMCLRRWCCGARSLPKSARAIPTWS